MACYYCKHLAEFALFAQRIKSCSSSTARVHDDIIVMRSCLWKGSSAESLGVLLSYNEQKPLTQTSVTVLSLWYIAWVAFLEGYRTFFEISLSLKKNPAPELLLMLSS